ncbi:hypothetical protein LINGRAHAP2_LOCUS7105 [Linum grandiflorum]
MFSSSNGKAAAQVENKIQHHRQSPSKPDDRSGHENNAVDQ